jgi:glycosyltransferase involved in cell wall biosynthesis
LAAIRIGINALYLLPGGVGGTEIYLRSLLRALSAIDSANQYVVFANEETGAGLDCEVNARACGFQFVRCPVKAAFRPARILFEQFCLPGLLERYEIDVLLNPGFTMPALSRCPSVTVFHDLQHKRHPGFFKKLDLVFWNLLLWLAAVRSRSLIAVSPQTAEDLGRYLPASLGKIHIIPHGVDPEMFRVGERRLAAHEDQSPYLLTVSTLHPHKNLDRLLDAFLRFREKHPGYRLVIAGLKGFATDRFTAHSRSLGLGESVEFTGWIPRRDLYGLFERADAFIYPSLFEGFGMPVSEALAAGIPTACSAIAPLDWVGGGAVDYFDPHETASILRSMERITGDPVFRGLAATAGRDQAKRFDWGQAAAATLAELQRQAFSR